ncbi:MAG: hypothetical protein IKI45_00680 [Oscillospiraceae bacterium]|nr:hypothetical protein [Oscillospiraceae bacterium]
MSKYVYYDLADVISFLKDRDFSLFIFESDEKFAVVYTEETGEILIDNVSDNVIPEEKVRKVLDECLEQAYDWLGFWDFENDTWCSGEKWVKEWCRESIHDRVKKEFEITGISFEETENKDQRDLVHKYRLEPKQKKVTYGFSIDFTAGYYPLEFTLKYSCEDRRLYAIETYII